MNLLTRTVIVGCLVLTAGAAFGQASQCANPTAPRIGLMISKSKIDEGTSSSLATLMKREQGAEIKLRDELQKRLESSACIVTSMDIFDDPKNYPQLRGSTVFNITAEASPSHPTVFALSVTATAAEGILWTQTLPMFTIPVLIETEADYSSEADGVLHYWGFWGKAMSQKEK